MNQNESKIRYILYVRKSSEDDGKQVQSIQDQIDRMQELAKEVGINIVRTLKESKSAKAPGNRPMFEKMIEEIEKGNADGILCWQTNRLFRNPVDAGKVRWLLQQEEIKSIQTIDKEYLPGDNALILCVEDGLSNQFIRDLRKNTMRGLESKLNKGWYPGKAPTGYLNDKTNKTIIKDPERFDLIRKAWDMLLEGNHTTKDVLDSLNDDWGYRSHKTRKKGGKKLSVSGFYRVINNPFYSGIIQYGDKTYTGKHEPMITVNEFEKVQGLLHKSNKPKRQKNYFAYTGIINCDSCGCLITAEKKRKFIKSTRKYQTYDYYRCTRRKKDVECRQSPITLQSLEEQIVKEIEKYTIPKEFRDWALAILKDEHKRESKVKRKSHDMLNKTYLSLKTQMDNLTDMRMKDQIDDIEFANKKKSLAIDIVKTRKRLNENQDGQDNWYDTAERAFDFVTNARQAFINGDLQTKREILSALGQTYTLKDKQLYIKPNAWLEPISNHTKSEVRQDARLELTALTLSKANTTHSEYKKTLWGD